VENALFATLDPTVRRATLPDGRTFTLTDTVGFVRHLPHQLGEAFKSTLEEISDADLILHIVDGSHPDPESQLAAVREVFAEIGARDVREVVVVNKTDVADEVVLGRLRREERNAVFVSAKTGEGLEALIGAIDADLPRPLVEVDVLLPYQRGDLVSRLHTDAELISEEHTGDGTRVKARVAPGLAAELSPYSVP
ncbi:MAG TPA: GTPase, partial [Mycobacteriales bacterium]|nr:GTPase [Mycobacteriales bacterium]